MRTRWQNSQQKTGPADDAGSAVNNTPVSNLAEQTPHAHVKDTRTPLLYILPNSTTTPSHSETQGTRNTRIQAGVRAAIAAGPSVLGGASGAMEAAAVLAGPGRPPAWADPSRCRLIDLRRREGVRLGRCCRELPDGRGRAASTIRLRPAKQSREAAAYEVVGDFRCIPNGAHFKKYY